MSKHSTQFEATEGNMQLTNAILLYHSGPPQSTKGREAFASIHPVELIDGHPVIGAGEPISRGHLRNWTETIDRSAAPELLPENVLVAHADMLAWWTPEQVRPAFFDITEPPESLRVLDKRTTAAVPYPAHLFIATRVTLYVFALPANQRPSADTKVLYSPVLNVFISGDLCWGNIAAPKSLGMSSMATYERAVFDSWSTHPNLGQDQTVTGKGGLVRLWDDLAADGAKRFPVKRLKPFRSKLSPGPATLGGLISELSR